MANQRPSHHYSGLANVDFDERMPIDSRLLDRPYAPYDGTFAIQTVGTGAWVDGSQDNRTMSLTFLAPDIHQISSRPDILGLYLESDNNSIDTELRVAAKRPRSDSLEVNTDVITTDIRCEPCDKPFTERRSLLRHLREARCHQTDDDPYQSFGCAQCDVSCIRLSDLRRHERKIHGVVSGVCTACGVGHSSDVAHEEYAGLNKHNRAFAQRISYRYNQYPFPLCAAVPEADINTDGMDMSGTMSDDPLEKACLHEHITGQVSGNPTHKDLLVKTICGYCQKPFPRSITTRTLHLNKHYKELKKDYTCYECSFIFVLEADFVHHQQSALSSSHCGFIIHEHDCTGHHPPGNSDREEFSLRVWNWEHSQLQLFERSIEALRGEVEPPSTHESDPLREELEFLLSDVPQNDMDEKPDVDNAILDYRYDDMTTFKADRVPLYSMPPILDLSGTNKPWPSLSDAGKCLSNYAGSVAETARSEPWHVSYTRKMAFRPYPVKMDAEDSIAEAVVSEVSSEPLDRNEIRCATLGTDRRDRASDWEAGSWWVSWQSMTSAEKLLITEDLEWVI